MESNTKKYSLKEFPTLIQIVCDAISTENPDENLLQTCSQIICNSAQTEDIIMLRNFWNDDIPEGTSMLTKAIMYECLYLIYSSFINSTIAYDFLYELFKTIP